MRYDYSKLTLGVDNLLPSITHPLHRAILLNYRRHAILEVSALWEGIFAEDMTVEVPRYKIHGGALPDNGEIELIGEDVQLNYKTMKETHTNVIMLENEKIAVCDWGFFSEATFHTIKPGRYVANATGDVLDDLDAMYIETRQFCMAWPYDERGRMIGEHVYSAPTAILTKCKPEDLCSTEEVRAILMPGINEPATLELVS